MKERSLRMNHWHGDFPLPGQFCKTRNGIYAYRILEVRRAPTTAKYAAKFIVERIPAGQLQPDDVVFEFWWMARR